MKVSGDSDLAYIIFCCLSSSPQKNTWWVSERDKDGVIDSISDKRLHFLLSLLREELNVSNRESWSQWKDEKNLVPLKTMTLALFCLFKLRDTSWNEAWEYNPYFYLGLKRILQYIVGFAIIIPKIAYFESKSQCWIHIHRSHRIWFIHSIPNFLFSWVELTRISNS